MIYLVMDAKPNYIYVANAVWRLMSRGRRSQCIALSILMLFAASLEMLSIGSIVPFITILTMPKEVLLAGKDSWILEYALTMSGDNLLVFATVFFVCAFMCAAITRFFLVWVSIKVAFGIGSDLSLSMFNEAIHQPYLVHTSRNSSVVISGVTTKVGALINNLIIPVMNLLAAMVLMLGIILLLVLINPYVSVAAFFGFGFIYVAVVVLTSKIKIKNSLIVSESSTLLVKAIQEALGGIREVILGGYQSLYIKLYSEIDSKYRQGQATNQILALGPKHIIEGFGVLVIALIAYQFSGYYDSHAYLIPALGAIAIAAQRLLPVMQQAYVAWSSMQNGYGMIVEAISLLERSSSSNLISKNKNVLRCDRRIYFDDVTFSYPESNKTVLNHVTLEIKCGDRVGVVGPTGSGKSTFIDLFMGLLQPKSGHIFIDDILLSSRNSGNWQVNISHVPQSIFLIDGTVAENIAFGFDLVDIEKVKLVAEVAQISGEIESWANGYQTRIGERGVRLSGGQRQRIGIARALYKDASFLVLDEATSALDDLTEKKIIAAINDLRQSITIIMVAHRVTTLEKCNQLVVLDAEGGINVGDYQDIVVQYKNKV